LNTVQVDGYRASMPRDTLTREQILTTAIAYWTPKGWRG
jgi:hypothetical protein